MFFRKRTSGTESNAAGPAGERGRSPSGSVIGSNTRFRGEVRGGGPLSIRGDVRGSVGMVGRLIVEPGGHLEADGRLAEVIIAGSAGGALEISGTLTVLSTGTIEGRIQSARLRVEEGARIQGAIHPLRPQSTS